MSRKPVIHMLKEDCRQIRFTLAQVRAISLTVLIIGLVCGYCLARAQEERRHYLHTTYPDLYGREAS